MTRTPAIDAHLRGAAPRPVEPLSDRLWRLGYDACAVIGFTAVLCFVGLMALQVLW